MKISKYKTFTEWAKAEPKAYHAAEYRGILKEICDKLNWVYKRHSTKRSKTIKWTLELCKQEAKKYLLRAEWAKNSRSSCNAAQKNNWLTECCSHMEPHKESKPKGYWTKEKCLEEAKKYNSKTEWAKASFQSYSKARKQEWFKECCTHMKPDLVSWTFEMCKEEAKKYANLSDWHKNHPKTYTKACRKKWVDACCVHMTSGKKRKGYWTIETCIEEAKKYKTQKEWNEKSPISKQKARKLKIMNECCLHMEKIIKPPGYWTLEKCKEDALNYKSRGEWIGTSSYTIARRNGWLDECTKHMIKKKIGRKKY